MSGEVLILFTHSFKNRAKIALFSRTAAIFSIKIRQLFTDRERPLLISDVYFILCLNAIFVKSRFSIIY